MLKGTITKITFILAVLVLTVIPESTAWAEKTTAVTAANIIVINNRPDIVDTVTVKGLSEGMEIKIYNQSTAGNVLGTAIASEEGIAVAAINDLGSGSGKVYVTATASGKEESTRIAASYTSDQSTAPSASTIIVTNRYGLADTVVITGLVKDDVITVYSAATGDTVLGTITATAKTMTISIEQLGSIAGKIYVTKTSTNKRESVRTVKAYALEPAVPAYGAGSITVSNKATGSADTIIVAGLMEGDTVKVYNTLTGDTVLGTATAEAGSPLVIINVDQLGVPAGYIFVTRTVADGVEGVRIKKAYLAEPVTTAPSASNVVIANNKEGVDDTVTVKGLPGDTIVKIYSEAVEGRVLGEATVDTWETSVTIKIKELGAVAGKVYITVQNTGKNRCARKAYSYASDITAAPSANYISVSNKYAAYDSVTVSNVAVGDVIRVYNAAAEGTLLGKVTATASKATVSVGQLGLTAGTVYITRTGTDKNESTSTAKTFSVESKAAFSGTFSLTAGSAGGCTKFKTIGTAADPQNDKLVYIITNLQASPVLAAVGSELNAASEAPELTAGSDISGVSISGNNIIDIYEIKSTSGEIVLAKRVKLASSHIKAPSLISAYATGTTLTLTANAELIEASIPVSAFKVKDGAVYKTVTAVAVENNTVTLTLNTAINDTNTISVSYTKPSATYLKDVSGNTVSSLTAGKIQVRTGLLKGATVIDKPGFENDGIGIMKLPAAAPGNSFRYLIYDGTTYFLEPYVGKNIAGWKVAVDGQELVFGFNAAIAHPMFMYIAEINADKIIVSLISFHPTNVLDYAAASNGYIKGTVSFAKDADPWGGMGSAISEVLNGIDRTFTVTVNGGTPITVTISSSVYNNSQFFNAIYSKVQEVAYVSFDESGYLVITSRTGGTNSKVTVSGADAALFFGASPKKVTGTAEAN